MRHRSLILIKLKFQTIIENIDCKEKKTVLLESTD